MAKQRRTCIYLCCLSCLPIFGQQDGAVKRVQSAPSPLITLDVVASDKSGKPISGLTEQDFTLLDNKQPRKIVSFHAVEGPSADVPVEVILLVDEVNDSFSNVAYERDRLTKFLQRDGGRLSFPVSLVFFSDSGATIPAKSSLDGKALVAELNDDKNPQRTIRRSQGIYGAGDRFDLSIRTLRQLAIHEVNKPGRKLVVWISPGWPLLSGPRIELTRKDQQQLFNTIVDLSAELRAAGITLYSVDPLGTADSGGFRTFYYKEFVKGVKQGSQVQFGNLALQVLAAQSGGRVLNSSNDVSGEIATCISDANAYYVLSFEAAGADGPNDYHSLDVKIDKPGITARTRTGYYAQPDQIHTP